MRNLLSALMFSSAVFVSCGASAATLDFTDAQPQGGGFYSEEGLSFDDIRIVNGNCDAFSGKGCGAFNDNETSVLTKVGGGEFTLTSFWYQLLGRGSGGGRNFVSNTFTVTSNFGGVLNFVADVVGHNDGGHVVDLTLLALFQNVTSLTFSTNGGGNVRLDDLAIAEPSPVPLPAAGLMLLAGLGGLASLRRRKSA
jgi:hypothetical protein